MIGTSASCCGGLPQAQANLKLELTEIFVPNALRYVIGAGCQWGRARGVDPVLLVNRIHCHSPRICTTAPPRRVDCQHVRQRAEPADPGCRREAGPRRTHQHQGMSVQIPRPSAVRTSVALNDGRRRICENVLTRDMRSSQVVTQTGEEVFFKIKRNTKLSKLQGAYANKVGKDVNSIR